MSNRVLRSTDAPACKPYGASVLLFAGITPGRRAQRREVARSELRTHSVEAFDRGHADTADVHALSDVLRSKPLPDALGLEVPARDGLVLGGRHCCSHALYHADMERDEQAAFLVALHRRGPLPPTGPAERADLLARLMAARFEDPSPGPIERRLAGLQSAVREARKAGGKLVESAAAGRRSALWARVVESTLAAYLSQLTIGLERQWGAKARAPLPQADGTPFVYPAGQSPTLKLPLTVGYSAKNVEAAIAHAVLDEISGGRSAGLCPYCREWWISPDARRRRTCGAPDCDTRRKAEWRTTHPEPARQVRARVRRWRKEHPKKKAKRSR
jgi:hypothetical protein